MGQYVNPGNDGFARVINSQVYVDKTGLLAYTNSVLDSEQAYICVTRPRRFGKSITAEMLTAYYDRSCDSSQLFAPYAISRSADYRKHLNHYPVIHFDMNNFCHMIDKETMQQITPTQSVLAVQAAIISELQKEYPDTIASDEVNLPSALAAVAEQTGEKFVIIIDEWDTIFRENKTDEAAQKAYIMLLRGLFKDAGSKKFLELAYITGILPIKKYGTESALNNFDEFSMTGADMLAEYVGFTEKEVTALCQQYDMDYEELKNWYDGYLLNDDIHVYNPKSVVDAIRRKRVGNYWTSTETYESLKSYICMDFDGLRSAIIEMLAGNRCHVDITTFENDMVSFSSRDDVLTVLVHLGYLAYDMDAEEVFIPNQEVRSAFVSAVRKSDWNYVTKAIEASQDLLRATWNKDSEAVAQRINEVHMENTSILTYNNENSLSCVITLAYYNAMNEYTLVRELPTGKGFADIVFLPRKKSDKPAMVIELKCDSSAQGAISQIKEKHYLKSLEEYQGKTLLVGINYDRNTKKHSCLIEEA